VLDGRGGADVLLGQAGSDTASYDDAPGPVTIDLGRILQPGEGDELFLVENVIGSPFGDVLTGDDQENRFVGGAGADMIAGAEDDDRIEVRDGERDRVDCGEDIDGPTLSDTDTVVSDRRTLDELTACETVDALPEPTRPGDGGDEPTGPATPDTAVSLSLRVPSRQRLLRQRSVRLTVGCLDEACTTVTSAAGRVARARISIGPLTVRLAPGAKRTLRLRLRPKQLSALRSALAAGRRPRLRLTVRARDAAGNALKRTARVTARR
jgi:RTX calcium-binding nonapeptide repeat (4 copies)